MVAAATAAAAWAVASASAAVSASAAGTAVAFGGGFGGGFGGSLGFGDIQGRPRPRNPEALHQASFSTGWTDCHALAVATTGCAVATTTIVRVAIMRAYRHGIAWLVFLVRALAVLGRVGLGRKAKHRGREAGVLCGCVSEARGGGGGLRAFATGGRAEMARHACGPPTAKH
eukprot:scaffold83736_cov62-Phaeocystis_antarctica.AAC.2